MSFRLKEGVSRMIRLRGLGVQVSMDTMEKGCTCNSGGFEGFGLVIPKREIKVNGVGMELSLVSGQRCE